MYIISEANGLQSVTDSSGNTTTFTADGEIDTDGTSLTFTRDSDNRITSITDPLEASRLTYQYDSYGDLDRRHRPETATSLALPMTPTTCCCQLYDPLGREGMRTEYDDSGRRHRDHQRAG